MSGGMGPSHSFSGVPEFVRANGRDLAEMKDNFQRTDLFRKGDAVLVWVNEGDLDMLEMSKAMKGVTADG